MSVCLSIPKFAYKQKQDRCSVEKYLIYSQNIKIKIGPYEKAVKYL